jgi:hypothetical protein
MKKRTFAVLVSAWAATVTIPAEAGPIFNASYVGSLTARLDWSSDLGIDLVNSTPNAPATGAPVTISAAATRDGRDISATITQTAPYVIDEQFWAGDFAGSFDIPGPGLYGLGAGTSTSGYWNFTIPGQTAAQNAATTFYYASRWTVTSPSDIHPHVNIQFLNPDLSGQAVGSSTLGSLASFGLSGFPMQLSFSAATFAQDSNQPGLMNFTYQIAFSTTQIDASVFDPPVTPVPEPSTLLLAACGAASALGYRRRTR